jgi:hypothetical protein
LFVVSDKFDQSIIFIQIWRFGAKADFHDNLREHPASVPTVNPFSELKLRLTSSLQSSERGRMIEETVSQTMDKTVKTAETWFNAIKTSSIQRFNSFQE